MNVWDICALPVREIADANSILFLWVTFPNLKEGLQVMDAWGFKYITLGFSWIKTNAENGQPHFGIGYYTKSNCEVCLIGTHGRPPMVCDYVSSVIISRRREHSRKPDEARERIVQLCGNLPRIELFSREKHEGWDVWGNETHDDMQCKIPMEVKL
jgi:N6-adenosine-specific RNA methylase IME4